MTINQLIETRVQCPYCWERFTILIDASVEDQNYIEDCEVCCRPIEFDVQVGDLDQIRVLARSQDD
jgi:hypothetical protein